MKPSPDDPYTAPRSAAPSGVTYQTTVFDQASLGRRFCNFVLDRILLAILATGLGVLLDWGNPSGRLPTMSGDFLILLLAIVFLYYVVQEALCGRTLGKWLTGTQVVNAEGRPPGWGRAILRTLCRAVPLEWLTFFGAEQRGLHNVASGTWVVRVPRRNR